MGFLLGIGIVLLAIGAFLFVKFSKASKLAAGYNAGETEEK
jgi:hypothetical protein